MVAVGWEGPRARLVGVGVSTEAGGKVFSADDGKMPAVPLAAPVGYSGGLPIDTSLPFWETVACFALPLTCL